ncbi:reticulon-4-interacting protein 1 homolog, mitochondrial-like isoform X2 [Neocloeon triangulifer]|uniref:reticulon-4-interacting protein 1 homolog, mitochondrial-like isoform X2 n=1 Tax=Neocloeon triangulifer TaxID=2078957 RepID=UPI00286FAE7C|nr:reticulon-4-interacting protein 1 homolog, mitochondrial-like isoform X2 [Neocloeon triangulifer]
MDEILLHISQRLEALQVLLSSTLSSSRVHLQEWSQQIAPAVSRLKEIFTSCLYQLNGTVINFRDNASAIFIRTWNNASPLLTDLQERLWQIIQWLKEVFAQFWDLVSQRSISTPSFPSSVSPPKIPDGLVGIPKLPNGFVKSLPSNETSLQALMSQRSLGFAIGCVVGLTLGLNWKHKTLFSPVFMKAIAISSTKGIEGVSLVDDAPSPVILEPDQVLIEVVASSIDSVDLAICTGYGRAIRRLFGVSEKTLVLGRDCSGVIVEVGQGVAWLARGDEVWLALPPWRSGAMSELIVAKEQQVCLKPKMLNFEAAAAVPYAALIAWDAAVTQGGLSAQSASRKRVLVRDAGSAVGCVLVQLCKFWGAHVTAVVSARGKEVARQIGASEVLVANIDLDMELRSRPRYDIVFNTVGPSLNVLCQRAVDTDGKIICTAPVAAPADSYGLVFGTLYALWAKIKYFLQGESLIIKPWAPVNQGRTVLEQIRKLVESGQLQPVVDRVFSAADAELAFQHASSNTAVGKTVVHFRTLGRGRCLS